MDTVRKKKHVFISNTVRVMANILIVDDEEMDRLLGRTFLEDAGHTPVFASDGDSALRVYEANDIDVVVTDLSMPNLDGLQLIQRLLEMDPDARIIAVSGAADKLGKAEGLGALGALMKPVLPEDLVTAVQKALDREGEDVWGGGADL